MVLALLDRDFVAPGHRWIGDNFILFVQSFELLVVNVDCLIQVLVDVGDCLFPVVLVRTVLFGLFIIYFSDDLVFIVFTALDLLLVNLDVFSVDCTIGVVVGWLDILDFETAQWLFARD